jgi:hypothetical protein
MKKFVWVDLPKHKGMFTNRNTVMWDLTSMKIIQHYAPNTKIELYQCTLVNGTVFLRTASAAQRELDWGFSAKSFNLPGVELASLTHLCSVNGGKSDIVIKTKKTTKPKTAKKTTTRKPAPKSEVVKARKVTLFNRLIKRLKKGKK